MFVRVKSTSNSPRKSVQIVRSVRIGNQVKQRIVRYIGIAMDDDELVRLKQLAEVVRAKIEQESQPALFSPEQTTEQVIAARQRKNDQPLKVNLKQLREQHRVVLGIHDVYGRVYEELGLHRLLPASRYRASNQALLHCVMARIAEPSSKRASVRMLEQEFGVHLSLEKVYRMMEQLDDGCIERLNQCAGAGAQGLFQTPLNVLFFDCTTLYFESFVHDELKQPGYSKDAKFKESQVLLALLVTEHGLPVGYELLPGASFEGHSLKRVIDQMNSRYQLKRLIFVADRGMFNEANLKVMEQVGAYYIVGACLKNLPRQQQAQVLEPERYQAMGEGGSRILSIPVREQRRLVVSWSPSRAEKDRHDREQNITKLMRRLTKSKNPKDLLSNYGYKKYLHVQGETQLSVDEAKVAQAQQWDGLHGVMTNLPEMPSEQVLEHYRGLWQVEETFRITKHDLKIRPMFHWTPQRIKAHVAMAFMSLMCVRHLSYRVALQYRRLSPAALRNALRHVQCSVLQHLGTKRRYVVPSMMNEEARAIYRLMGLPQSTTPYALD